MSDCCCKPMVPPRGVPAKCPGCGAGGQPVHTVTLQHMVKPEFLEAVTKPGFQFCRSPECDVVYFHPDGGRVTKAEVRVRIGLKEKEDPVPICYCFGFTEGMIREEIILKGKCTIPERIAAEMKAERCACEVRNPQGSCCFPNVKAAVKKLLALRSKAIA